jgi:hypothetical protein
VQIASRLSIPLLLALSILILASPGLARGRGGGPAHQPGHEGAGSAQRPEVTHPQPGPGEELNRGPVAERRGERRGCRRGVRPGPGIRCDYYYDDDDGQVQPVAVPGDAAPHQPGPGAAKIAPLGQSDGVVESYTPNSNKQLKEQLISARKNWVEKKSRLDAANAARARAEYQASQTGSSVDPALIERQREAKKEAATAHGALGPLVEQGRKAGFAPEVLDLYNRANTPD